MKRVLLAATATLALTLAAAATAAAADRPDKAQKGAAEPAPQINYGRWGFDVTGMDRAVKPGNDFFLYTDGGWVARTAIPADKTAYGAFDMLADLSEKRVHEILETSGGKIGAAYHAFMDEGRIEALGSAPLKPWLDTVRAAKDRTELALLMGRSNTTPYASIIGVGIEADAKDPTRYSVYLSQDGLGLPDRDYYLTPQFAEKKTAYQAYVSKMLRLVDWPDADARAAEIVAFETKIAEAHWTRAEQRDPLKVYNPYTVADLSKAAPQLPWVEMFREDDLGGVSQVVVTTPPPITKIAAIWEATPVETLKAWQAFHVADSAAPLLSKAFVEARFDFRNKTLGGQPQIEPRWKRAVRNVDGQLGEAVGEIYVAKYFPPESKAKMEALIADLKRAFARHIEALDWMGADTKKEALTKLANYDVQIGYPKKWRDYTALEIRPDDAFGNAMRSGAFEWAFQVSRLNKPVDKDQWLMTPQTVNAYNNPFFNEVVFPAAILQPPFFNPDADAAINYGAIGGVIGHEMTHGFDDEGRKFDSHGRLRDWWSAEDAKRFEAKASRLGAQYSAMEPVPGAHIKGELTMGENIADLGGLTLALEAYHASLNGRPAPVIGGFTGDQRVFLGWAQVWREKLRPDTVRQRLAVDPHSPPEARVNGVVHNIDAWYAAYGVKPTDKLYVAPAERVRIW